MSAQDLTSVKVEFPNHERPRTDIATAPMVGIAIVITLAVFGIAYTVGGFVKDLLMGVDKILIERVVFQSAITFVWALSVASVVLKLRRATTERATLGGDLMPADLDFTDTNRCVEVYERVRSRSNLSESLGLTRVARVLAMWINTGDFERVQQYARQQADLDAIASDASFRRNRLFIWAMPLLGFVGTVFGVAAGISGFAGFLHQANVSPEQIKEQVGLITTGLAVAFFCTLLGLLTAAIAAFPSLLAERKEEETLGEIDEFVEDRMVSRMPSGSAQESAKFPVQELAEAIRESMATQTKFPVEELAQAIDAGFRRLPNPDRYEEVFTRAVTKASDLINLKYDEFAQNYERRVGELGSLLGGKLEAVATAFNANSQRLSKDLNDQSGRVVQSLADLESRQTERMEAVVEEIRRLAQQMPEEFRKAQERYLELQAKTEAKTTERFEDLTEQITTVGKDQAEQFGDAHERYLAAIGDLDRKEIARWEKMVGEFNGLATRLAEQFRQAVTSLDASTARYSERVQESAHGLTQQLEKVGQLGVEIDKVLRATQSAEAAMRQLGSSDEFRQTLATLRTHLSTSDELLKQLSRPRKVVFQEARAEE